MKDFKFIDKVFNTFTIPAKNFQTAYHFALSVDGECLPVYSADSGETHTSMVTLFILPNGNLRILRNPFNPDAQEDLVELHRKTYDITADILEDGRYLGNGWTTIDPAQIGALTDSPIIGYDFAYADTGDLEYVEKVWWFPDYKVTDPYDLLIEKGFVDFEKGCDYEN
jgi:hypothetical protein